MMRFLLLISFLVGVHDSMAQDQKPVTNTLPAASRAFLVQSDPSLQFNHQNIRGGRVDLDSGVQRAAYRIEAEGIAWATPEQTARAWMEQNGTRFGWGSAADLVLVDEIRTPYTTHLTFQQMFEGVPVHRREVKVNLDADGLPTMVLSGYAPNMGALDTTPAVSSAWAKQRAQALVSTTSATTTEPALVVYPLATPSLAWRITAWPNGAPGEWEVLIDAHSGAVLHLLDRARYRHDTDSLRKRRRVDGRGQVWIPDPITSAGTSYGGSYVDNGDADSDALNDERRQVTLRDIELGTDNRYRLIGPYVTIDGSIGDAYTPPDEADADGFDYLRSNQHFEAVMVYYHIDASQRYVQTLGIGRDIQSGGVRANPHGLGTADNSAYFPGQNALAFGDGGIDDAEDAEVIIHEYGHALLEASSPGIATNEGSALHEGWSDYWAVSLTRGLMDNGTVPPHDWKKVFSWDGNETWSGRWLGSTATYPDGFSCVTSSGCNIYADGLIWATSMMEIYEAIGKRKTDRLNVASHGYLTPSVNFVDAAEAIVQADKDYHGGANVTPISRLLIARGYIEDTEPPVIEHQPTSSVVDENWPIRIEARITDALTIGAAWVTYEVEADNGGQTGTFSLANSGSHYSGSFPALSVPIGSRVRYRIWAHDEVVPRNQASLPPENEPPFSVHIVGALDNVSVLSQATATGLWTQDGDGSYAAKNLADESSALVSSIVLNPIDLPSNATAITFRMDHSARLKNSGGNVKIYSKETGGWHVVAPVEPHKNFFVGDFGHPMQAEPILAASWNGVTQVDLTDYAGTLVWLRIDLGTGGELGANESWAVRSVAVEIASLDRSFAVEPTLALHSNFPDPFSGHTTVSYSLPESMPVRLELYNVLGQRVASIVDGEMAEGTHTLHLDLPDLASGVYFLHMRAGRSALIERMYVAR